MTTLKGDPKMKDCKFVVSGQVIKQWYQGLDCVFFIHLVSYNFRLGDSPKYFNLIISIPRDRLRQITLVIAWSKMLTES